MRRVPAECQNAGADLAPDPVHDLRVALRRCRSLADGLMAIDPDPDWKRMKKAGRFLFRSLGDLRDVQVMIEWVGKLGPANDPETQALLDLLAHREQEHKITAAQAIHAFDLHQWRRWSRELPRRASRVKPGSLVFKHLALERWTEAHELHRRALRNRSQVSLHQLRIGIKRFRYIVENFLPQQHATWSNDLKELQDLLGDIHDLDVLWATATQVNAFSDPDSRQRWRQIILEAREKRLARYRERMVGPNSLWNIWRAELPQDQQIRNAALARLKLFASFLDPDFAHSQRVANSAQQLFDGLHRLGLGPASPNQDLRSILYAAALLHDVGRSKHEKRHHKIAYRFIRKISPPLGWNASDLQLVAVVARFHRGALPRTRHKALQELALDQKKIAGHLSGILRLAGALDTTSRGHSQKLKLEEKNGSLLLAATGYNPWTRAAENIAAATHLLQLTLRKPILVKPLASGLRSQGSGRRKFNSNGATAPADPPRRLRRTTSRKRLSPPPNLTPHGPIAPNAR
jgi:CHAD domain-containing protein